MAADAEYEEKLKAFLAERGVCAEHLTFAVSCHSVAEAAAAAHAEPDDFIKSICMLDPTGQLIVTIVRGADKASAVRVAEALGCAKPRPATPAEMLERTGYPCGGTPPFGYPAVFLMDERVLEKAEVIAGGGSERALIRIAPSEVLRVNGGRVAGVRA